MDQTQQQKWQGKVTTTLTKAEPEQVWLLFADFFNLNKWLPTLPTCYGIHGTNCEPGCIRYCAGFSIPPKDDNNSNNKNLANVSWSKERLVSIDHVQRCLRYEIVDSNIGFESYVSTVKIVDVAGEDGGGCVIEWSFEVNPVNGCVLDDMVNKYAVALQLIGKKMEDHFDFSEQLLLRGYSSPSFLSHMAETSEPKWEGKASVELKALKPQQVWPSVADFCNIQKWFPNLETCYQVDGELGRPGLVRYCASTPQPSCDGSGETTVMWAKEKLVMIDPNERCLIYEIVENNVGFKAYLATWKVYGDGQLGCKIEWSFVCDPIDGWKYEDFESYCYSCLQFMAKKIEDAVSSVSS